MQFYLFVFLTLVFSFGNAQQSKATYTKKVNMELDFSANPNMPKDVADRIKKRISAPQVFHLHFDKNQSIYKMEERLEAPQQGNGGERRGRWRNSGNQIVHTNLATRDQTTQQELLGKLFLVSKTAWSPEWNFSGETKQIGKYTAYEATYTYKKNPNQIMMPFGRRNNNEDSKAAEPKKVEAVVSAWFSPDIPIPAGPDRFFGLPGLVLMVQDGNTVYVCTEVQMNSSEKVTLTPPKKGKKVTIEEFNKIREERTKEMRERFQNNSNRRDQNRGFIRR